MTTAAGRLPSSAATSLKLGPGADLAEGGAWLLAQEPGTRKGDPARSAWIRPSFM